MRFVLDTLDKEIDKVVDAANTLKAGAHFGLVVFVDNTKLVDTGDLNGGKVHTKAASLRAAFTDAKATYTTPNRNPGDGPSGPTTQNPICEEDSLDALHDAANEFPWRSNAARVVILVAWLVAASPAKVTVTISAVPPASAVPNTAPGPSPSGG